MNTEMIIFPFDYIIILISIIIVIFSIWKGFIQSILGLLTWIGSILITIYAYDAFASFISKQLLKIEFLNNYEYFGHIFSIVIAIPLIFLISLFFLKKIRKFLSSDIDKQVLGILFDKIFGLLYGIIFSYLILTAFLVIIQRFNLNNLTSWMENNSNIINYVNEFNNDNINGINLINKIPE